jgi:hypothetical protein
VLGLAGCQTKVGAAAVVGGDRITEKQVDNYIESTTPNAASARSLVITYLVKGQLYQKFLADRHDNPSNSDLTSLHDTAISSLLSSQLGTGSAADALIDQVLVKAGIKTSYRPILLRATELEAATFTLLHVTSTTTAAEFFGAVAKAKISVSISPRYGSWDPARQDVADAKTPNFLAVKPTPSAAAN